MDEKGVDMRKGGHTWISIVASPIVDNSSLSDSILQLKFFSAARTDVFCYLWDLLEKMSKTILLSLHLSHEYQTEASNIFWLVIPKIAAKGEWNF